MTEKELYNLVVRTPQSKCTKLSSALEENALPRLALPYFEHDLYTYKKYRRCRDKKRHSCIQQLVNIPPKV